MTIDLSDVQMEEGIKEQGGLRPLARHLNVPVTSLRKEFERRNLMSSIPPRISSGSGGSKRRRSKLSMEHIDAAMQPANNCRVRIFREGLRDDEREALDYALSQDRRDLSAAGLRQLLIDAGFPSEEVPGVDAINAHRVGQRPCRCKG